MKSEGSTTKLSKAQMLNKNLKQSKTWKAQQEKNSKDKEKSN